MRVLAAVRHRLATSGPAGRRRRLGPLALLALAAAAGCKLTDVTVARPEDVVVAEVVLQAGALTQLAWLHRTLGNGSVTVPGATVQITGPGGAIVAFRSAPATECVDSSRTFSPDTAGSCYLAPTSPADVVPGATYTLAIVTADGRHLTGTTTVPGAFRLTRPGERSCVLAPQTLLPVTWTRSSGAWVYVSEMRLLNVRELVNPNTTDHSPLDVQGFSVSAEDTTIVFPSEFGLFQRADSADAPVLLALQKGLPAGVAGTVAVSAADRNYVNWVRRGAFNPSGAVQIPSVEGDGTGVFGSLVPVRFDVAAQATTTLPSCTSS